MNFLEGEVLLLDKPLGWTSFDVVNKIKYALRHQLKVKKIKVGHAGTLDPLATGLLIVCTGKKTKSIDQIQDQYKTYTGTIVIGATTASFDRETPVENEKDWDHLTINDFNSAAESLCGEYEQMPPIYSAKSIDGTRAYKLARAGKTPEMKTKRIQVFTFSLTAINGNEIDFLIKCSKGTYIRTIANDFGNLLKVGAYLKSLRRTEIGEYSIEKAYSIEKVIEFIQSIQSEN